MKPPVELTVSLKGPGGARWRLAPDAAGAANRPLDVSFSTEAGEGFATGQVTLRRPYDSEFPDLALLNEIVVEGFSGQIAYEGRIQGVPRSLQAGGPEVRMDCQGWMSHARSQPFTDLIIDRAFDSWGPSDQTRRAGLLTAGNVVDKEYTSEVSDALVLQGNEGNSITANQMTELWYRSPVEIVSVGYRGTAKNTANILPASYDSIHGYRDLSTFTVTGPLTLDNTVRTVAFGSGTRMLLWYVKAGSTHTPAAAFNATIDLIAVVGNHGLTTVPGGDGMPSVRVSDAIIYLFNRYAPQLNTSQMATNGFPVPHAVWREPTTAHDAVKGLNVYSQWALGVYENRQVEYRPFDLSTYDWEVGAGQDGVEVETQGVTVDDAFNGVIIQYQDFAGTDQIITPDQATDLQDPNPAIAANQWGERAWATLQLSNPQTADGAVQIGRLYLADLNRPRFPSTITVPGHIRDRHGNWQPAWRARANQTISVRNHPNDHPRLITGTSWQNNQLQITTDNALNRMEAILTRLDRGRNPGGN